jgi:hypothetical protein
MRDTTFPVYDEQFSHHDSHPYANDRRQFALTFVGLLLGAMVVAAFVAVLAAYTPH